MFPSQTSLIPVTVALSKFLEANGTGGVYPFWYLGTTPFKFLIGPVVPYFLVSLKKLVPAATYFDLALFLTLIGLVIGAFGWGMFAYQISRNRRIALWVSVLVLLMPWHWVSAFGMAETSAVVASGIIPWVLLAFARISNLKFRISNFKLWLGAITFALLLLTNTTAAVSAIVGLILLSITNYPSTPLRASKLQISNLKRVMAVVLIGWLLTLWWYSPAYWLTVWGAPGIGGKNILGVLGTLLNFLRGFLPVIAAVLFVFWKVKPKTAFDKFSLGWLVLFGSLTLFRFMADWDFWMDWTAWISEVEVGLALLLAKWIQDSPFEFTQGKRFKIQDLKAGKFLNPKPLIMILLILGGGFLAWQNRGFWLPRKMIIESVEYRVANELEKIVKPDQTVFLSGTSAFWLNSLADVKQVRGGRDEGSVDSRWREVVWEVREGEFGRDSVDILKRLGVDFLVVHTDKSSEYYHDFKYPQKFDDRYGLQKVYDFAGDKIYRIN